MRAKYSEYTDEELYILLSQGKKQAKTAFDELYSRYSTNIYTYCLKIIGDEEIAHDLFQEAFTKFYQSAKKNKDMKNVAGYLLKIARNLCLNEKGKKYHNNVSIEDFHFPVYDTENENRELKEILETALEALPENYREVIIMKEYLDMSYKEIAQALDVTLSVVRVRIFRAKAKLRKILNPYFEDFQK